MNNLPKEKAYNNLLDRIGQTYSTARENAKKAINFELIRAYWSIGNYIVEYEQKGSIKADYGDKLILQLAKDLKYQYGKGFSKSNLVYMRLFYIKYPKIEMISTKLFWSHYFELLKLDGSL